MISGCGVFAITSGTGSRDSRSYRTRSGGAVDLGRPFQTGLSALSQWCGHCPQGDWHPAQQLRRAPVLQGTSGERALQLCHFPTSIFAFELHVMATLHIS